MRIQHWKSHGGLKNQADHLPSCHVHTFYTLFPKFNKGLALIFINFKDF